SNGGICSFFGTWDAHEITSGFRSGATRDGWEAKTGGYFAHAPYQSPGVACRQSSAYSPDIVSTITGC
ncbi:MAG: hypothetical protein P8Y42_12580, partial [Exilibacterium sp.]